MSQREQTSSSKNSILSKSSIKHKKIIDNKYEVAKRNKAVQEWLFDNSRQRNIDHQIINYNQLPERPKPAPSCTITHTQLKVKDLVETLEDFSVEDTLLKPLLALSNPTKIVVPIPTKPKPTALPVKITSTNSSTIADKTTVKIPATIQPNKNPSVAETKIVKPELTEEQRKRKAERRKKAKAVRRLTNKARDDSDPRKIKYRETAVNRQHRQYQKRLDDANSFYSVARKLEDEGKFTLAAEALKKVKDLDRKADLKNKDIKRSYKTSKISYKHNKN